MKLLINLLLMSMLFGTVVSIPLAAGVNIYMHDIAVFLLVGVAAFTVVRRRRLAKPTLIGPIAAFAAAALWSLLVNWGRFAPWQIAQAGLYLIRWILYAGVYASIVQAGISAPFLLTGLFWTGTAFSMLGLVQFFLYPDLRNLWYLGWDPHYWRLFSTLLDPNFAGIWIVVTILLGLSINLFSKKTSVLFVHMHRQYTSYHSFAWWGAQSINMLALYFTYSRGSYLAFAVGFGVWVALEKNKLAALVFVVFASAILFIPRPGGETLRLGRVDSTISRLENWQEAVTMFKTSPIIGYGFNTLRFIPRPQDRQLPDQPVSRSATGVDNSMLFLLVTTGVIGLASHVWLLWSIWSISPVFRPLMTAILVHSMFTNTLFYPWIMIWIWVFVAASEKSKYV